MLEEFSYNPKKRIPAKRYIAMVDTMLQEGFTRPQVYKMAGIKAVTFSRMLKHRDAKITQATADRIEVYFNEYLRYKIDKNNLISDEDVIDRQDAEDGAKEVFSNLLLVLAIIVVLIIGLVTIVQFIINLF